MEYGIYNLNTTTTQPTDLWPLYSSTCLSRHLQLRTGGFFDAKFYCPHALLMATNVFGFGKRCWSFP